MCEQTNGMNFVDSLWVVLDYLWRDTRASFDADPGLDHVFVDLFWLRWCLGSHGSAIEKAVEDMDRMTREECTQLSMPAVELVNRCFNHLRAQGPASVGPGAWR